MSARLAERLDGVVGYVWESFAEYGRIVIEEAGTRILFRFVPPGTLYPIKSMLPHWFLVLQTVPGSFTARQFLEIYKIVTKRFRPVHVI